MGLSGLGYTADRHPLATAPGVSLQAPELTSRSTSPWAFPSESPPGGPGIPQGALPRRQDPQGLMGSGRYLVVRGLLQHLRAKIGAEVELPAPKIAPGQEQRLHVRAHGCRGPPVKDLGRTRGGRGPRSGRRPALPGNARRRGPSQRGVRLVPENRKKKRHREHSSATGLPIS